MGDVQHASQHGKATELHHLEGKTSKISEKPKLTLILSLYLSLP
ncbi:protein of unknown function [Vibrio tapetis subsp. tapetis]|uniref:Uncharacterized protein n=1 Tax=Vibrio tapetis subsp. tapetis TaxID=1671868 RepID=A0A2N8ZC91_9VIBR|nr:protein of unknown function [Vibrio tapetis subsp. tapetis]SON48499.1 protein of unknown function [Vibrio tapetis subsp. tapetis]SON49522.1 protein of unknown function [Vibrio tapetis subsp. tapetis]SON50376.1 protein of unknown function [Vibrio tapetis subsp. tapetis]SON50429.1 protein of unknown function [Vibrio tapetis subsp. tapetis]